MRSRTLALVPWVLTTLAAGQEPPPASWLAQAEQQIRTAEYHFSSQPDGTWSAPNRAHGLRAKISGAGIVVTPRSKDGWTLGLTLVAWGRDDALSPVGSATCSARDNRTELVRERITEWYVNSDAGLEQGFTIAAPPQPAPPTGPLVLEVELSGGLGAFPSEDGQAVVFKTGEGVPVLRYGGLKVTDATTNEVAARMVFLSGRLQIRIDDMAAVYPLEVDPLMTSPAWTGESDQPGANFATVGTAGDVNGDGYSDVVAGARRYDNVESDEGRVFLYLGSASGLATSPAWTAESNQADALFGADVATAGDVNGDGYADVVVGAFQYSNAELWEGAAFLYLGSASGLATSAAWFAESNQVGAAFGYSVATAGDVNGDGYSDVVVGAFGNDNGQTDEGRAFLYLGSASGLATSPAWTAESNQAGAFFGYAVATAGDVNGDGHADVVVGANGYSGNHVDEGRVFLYLGSPSGLAAAPTWTAEGNQASSRFGQSVASAGDVNGDGYSDVAIGAYFYDNGQDSEGRAVLYLGSASGLDAFPAWTAEGNQASAYLGISVATAGDVNGDGYSDIVVGAYRYDNVESDEGRAFLYLGSASGLATSPAWTAEVDQEFAEFGYSVATAGDVNGDGYSDVVVGAYAYDNGQSDEGGAFLYYGSAAALTNFPVWTAESDQANAAFGFSVATGGDVNGDGYSDVVAGAYAYDNGQSDEGRAFLYLGSAVSLSTTPAWTAESNQAGALFGRSVATAGDVNGDGYSDLVVAAIAFDNVQGDEGRAFLYLGSASGLATSPAWTAESNQALAYFGCVATAGDVNGDGYADVVVGTGSYNTGAGGEGRAFLYLGSAVGLGTAPAWTAESNQALASFGQSVATAGDVNGDGYSDVVVGAHGYDNVEDGEGRAFLYLGSAAGLGTAPAWTAESNQALADFGASVATAGDVNGDGYSDLVVGAHAYDNVENGEGRAFLYLGSASGLATSPAWTAESDQIGAEFGNSVATAGDVNGDGYSDVVVGARLYLNGENSEGRAFLYLGSALGLAVSSAWTAEVNQPGAGFGISVATAGDVNGDGYSDVVVGAWGHDNGQSNEGRAFLYYGNGGDGLDRIPRQARADGTAPIALLGKSDAQSSFRLRALGRTPAGRGRVRIESEVKPLGVAFGGTGLVASPLEDTGAPGIAGSVTSFDELQSGLTAGIPYRWRLRIVSDSPWFPRSPWFSLPYNSRTETDLRTPDCIDVAPAGTPVLTRGPATQLSWTAVASATGYDIVRGDLTSLRATAGNFTAAIEECVDDDRSSTTVPIPGAPAGGEAFFYLVRPTNCGGVGSYDSGAPSQIGSRDAEIAASTSACP